MRSQKDGDAVIGPFVETTAFEAILSEMGRLGVHVGEILEAFFTPTGGRESAIRLALAQIKRTWLSEFYPFATNV